jgi:hypothetical protein
MLGRRWSPIGPQPVVADGARQKQAENLSGAVHLGTGAEVAPFGDQTRHHYLGVYVQATTTLIDHFHRQLLSVLAGEPRISKNRLCVLTSGVATW